MESSCAHRLPFAGVREETPLETFLGWTVHYNEVYRAATRAQDLESIDEDSIIVAGAAHDADGTTGLVLDTCACGRSKAVLRNCQRWQQTEHNGLIWYLERGRAFGFADEAIQRRGGADVAEGPRRLSWHLDGQGGYRAGWIEHLNHDTSWRKLVLKRERPGLIACGLHGLWQLPAEEMAAYGSCVRLQGDGIASQLVHSSLLRCRSPALFRFVTEQGAVHLPGITSTGLEDFVAFLYTAQLPWDRPGPDAEDEPLGFDTTLCFSLVFSERLTKNTLSSEISVSVVAIQDSLEQRVSELRHVASVAEMGALERGCHGWLVTLGHISSKPPPEKSAEALETASWSSHKVAAGAVVGQGPPGAVLEDDVATLVEELSGPGGPKEDMVTLVLGRRDDASSDSTAAPRLEAHRLVLGACSGFFAAALSSAFLERDGIVHLGFVEEQGLRGDGANLETARSAFRRLIHFLYTGKLDVDAACAVDLLALLQGNFLQLDERHVARACAACEVTALAGTLQELPEVTRRAEELGFDDLTAAALSRLAELLCEKHACQAFAVKGATAKLSHSLLVDLVALLVEKSPICQVARVETL